MFSNKCSSKLSSNRSNKKTVRRVHTEIEQPFATRKTQLSNRQSQQHQSKHKYLDVYSKYNLKESMHPRKTFKVNTIKQPIIKQMKTQPDQVVRKATTQSTNNNIDNDNNNNNNSTGKYQIDSIAGKGTFGTVYIGYVRPSGLKIAIKKVLQDKRYKNRELEILKMLKNTHVLEMRDYFLTYEGEKQYLNVVMDYYPYNLFQVIKKKQLTATMIKIIIFQILKGLNYLSTLSIAHRDIKPQNILIDIVKNRAVICDFGSAKQLIIGQPNLSYICSRCYRAPQLIFGSTDYTSQIDMWSMGCVLVEMVNGIPPFLGDSQIDQLIEIIRVLGTPSKDDVLQMNKNYDMKQYSKFPVVKAVDWRNILNTKDQNLIDLIFNILQYSPKKRLTPAQAIMHEYFNQLREQNSYKQLLLKCKAIPQLFQFSKQQLKKFTNNQQPIPKWIQGNSGYTNQNYGKMGTISIKRPIHRFV